MQLGHMHNEVFCLDTSPRLLTLLAVNQFRAPGTNRVKARAKLGSTVDIHADSAIASHSERRHAHAGRRTQRAKRHAWANKFFELRNLAGQPECRFAVASAQHIGAPWDGNETHSLWALPLTSSNGAALRPARQRSAASQGNGPPGRSGCQIPSSSARAGSA
jgi:hypothetical protein